MMGAPDLAVFREMWDTANLDLSPRMPTLGLKGQ
jgi:hypothetical protein